MFSKHAIIISIEKSSRLDIIKYTAIHNLKSIYNVYYPANKYTVASKKGTEWTGSQNHAVELPPNYKQQVSAKKRGNILLILHQSYNVHNLSQPLIMTWSWFKLNFSEKVFSPKIYYTSMRLLKEVTVTQTYPWFSLQPFYQ